LPILGAFRGIFVLPLKIATGSCESYSRPGGSAGAIKRYTLSFQARGEMSGLGSIEGERRSIVGRLDVGCGAVWGGAQEVVLLGL